MKKTFLSLTLLSLLLLVGCNNRNHFISDSTFRAKVENDLNAKKAALPHGDLFSVFDQDLTLEEREALAFLYAYMPIGDITDYDSELYLNSVRYSFMAKEEMPWGKAIPEYIFRHFVLPVRVNNENLDESRMVFYDELKDRVKGLSLYDAVLEVNHWCHEKVIYTPSDSRTSAALASVKTAYGRCGEESTFTTAALRAVGIPARQVYTPRWAHTDDNHAWVEAWVDGEWMFLGACEPEPILNLGWFNGPAYRGMLMHTKVFGHYNGPEEVMVQTSAYTEINVINNYAPTARVDISVVDKDGKAAGNANVEFKIFNYAEYNSVAIKTADADGKTFLSAGKGDMLVWASKDGMFGFTKVSFGKDEQITITLDHKPGDAIRALDFDIIPPVDGSIPADVTDEQKAATAERMLEGDDIRNRYVATFYTEEKAKALAKELNISEDDAVKFLVGSRGNWDVIEAFLRETPAADRAKAISLLNVVSAKDLRDTPIEVFRDHLKNSTPTNSALFDRYVMNPRVLNELISPYRAFLQKEVDATLAEAAKADPTVLVNWVKENIQINDELNPHGIPIMPKGVWTARVADKYSRNIFFVALARSLGIPARVEPVARKIQFNKDNTWVDVNFDSTEQVTAKQGKLVMTYNPTATLDNPRYNRHFSIAKIFDDGTLQTLNFRSNRNVDMGLGNTWAGLFKNPLALDEGNYMLVTGNRLANGSVLSQVSFFNIEAGKTERVSLVMRENEEEIQVIGTLDAESLFKNAETGEVGSILSTTGRGYFVVAVLGARQEPTNHAMRNIASLSADFERWGRSMILLFRDEQGWNNFDANEFGTLPSTITYGIDIDDKNIEMLLKGVNLDNANTLPVFVIADTFGRIVFVSQGYTIGLGEQMMNVINKL